MSVGTQQTENVTEFTDSFKHWRVSQLSQLPPERRDTNVCVSDRVRLRVCARRPRGREREPTVQYGETMLKYISARGIFR